MIKVCAVGFPFANSRQRVLIPGTTKRSALDNPLTGLPSPGKEMTHLDWDLPSEKRSRRTLGLKRNDAPFDRNETTYLGEQNETTHLGIVERNDVPWLLNEMTHLGIEPGTTYLEM